MCARSATTKNGKGGENMKIDWSFVITIAAICIILLATMLTLQYKISSDERIMMKAIESEANIVIKREVF